MKKLLPRLVDLLIIVGLLCAVTKASARTIELDTSNTVILDRDIDLVTMDLFASAMLFKRASMPPNEMLYVLIVSPGGLASVSYSITEFLGILPNVAVICKFCASGAGLIFAAVNQPKYAIAKSVAVMHEMFIPKCTARIAQNKPELQSLIRDSLAFDKMMAKALSMPLKDYQERINNKEWTLKGKELVDFKMADELITVTCTPIFKQMAPDTCGQ